jgi:nucleolar protein 12
MSHSRKRAKTWKAEEDEADEGKVEGMSEGMKKKVAFIRGEVNESSKACNAYAVIEPFDGKDEQHQAYEDIVSLFCEHCDNKPFQSHVLRVDKVSNGSASQPSKSELAKTIYVGNLDFAQTEEGLREEMEKVLTKEMGDGSEKLGWVTKVRIIRDRKTGLGKGFAYVGLRVSLLGCRGT